MNADEGRNGLAGVPAGMRVTIEVFGERGERLSVRSLEMPLEISPAGSWRRWSRRATR